jgi:hypothetical protein
MGEPAQRRDSRQARGAGLRRSDRSLYRATGLIGFRSGWLFKTLTGARTGSRVCAPTEHVVGGFYLLGMLEGKCSGVQAALCAGQPLTAAVAGWQCVVGGGTRHFEMKACVVTADAPGHALAVWTVVFAGMVQVGAALVPELVTSTGPKGGVAVVAGPGGQSSSRREEWVAEACVWRSGRCHERRVGALRVRHVSLGG